MSNVAAGKDLDDEGESLNNVEKVLNKLDIKLRDNIGTWRSFEDVIDEVAGKWKSFTDPQKGQIATAIAGTRQQELFRSLMANYDQVGNLAKVAADSTGSATKRMEIYLESVEAKTNQLKATWEAFITSLNQSESYKQMLDIATWMLNNMPIMLQYGSSLLSMIIVFKSHKIAESLIGIKAAFTDLILNIQKFVGIFTGSTIVIKSHTAEVIKATLVNKTMSLAEQELAIKEALVAQGIAEETAAEIANNMVKKGSIALTNTLTLSSTALSVAIGLIFAAIAGVTMAVANYNTKLSMLSSEVDTTTQKMNALDSDAKKLQDTFGKLSTIEDEFSKKLIDEQERATQLKSIESELNSVYEEKIGKIDLVNKGYKEQIELLNTLNEGVLNEEISEVQKGNASAQKLLDRHVNTYFGQTSQYKDLSDETRNKLAELVSKNNLKSGANIYGNNFLRGTARDLKNFTNELEEYRQELIKLGKTKEAQKLANMLGTDDILFGAIKGLKSEDETTGSALDVEKKANYLEFKQKNLGYFTNYQSSLTEGQSISEEFNKKKEQIIKLQQELDKATTQKEKNSIQTRIKNAQVELNKYYDLLVKSAKKIDAARNALFGLTTDKDKDIKSQLEDEFKDLEGKVNLKTDNSFIDNLKDKNSNLYDSLKKIDDAFEKGQISATEYFNNLNKQIKNLKTDNLEEVKNIVENLFGNNISYADNFIGELFENSVADAEDVKNLQAYTSNVKELVEYVKAQDKKGGLFEGKTYDTFFGERKYSKEQTDAAIVKMTQEADAYSKKLDELQQKKADLVNKNLPVEGSLYKQGGLKSKGTYRDGNITDVEVYHESNQQWERLEKNSSMYETYSKDLDKNAEQYKSELKNVEKQIEDTTKAQSLLNDRIKEMDKASKNSEDYISDLEELGRVLEGMEIDKTQDAFKTMEQGFENGVLSNTITTLDSLPAKYKSAFIEIADDIVVALGSSNEEVRKQAESSLEALVGTEAEMLLKTVDFSKLTEEQMAQVSESIANKTIVAQGGVSSALSAMATESNKVAATAMGKSVQKLGEMLDEMGKALQQMKVTIPVKIPKIMANIAGFVAGTSPLVTMNGTENSEISIGGDGTVANFGAISSVLKNKDYADVIGKLMGDGNGSGKYNPYSFNPKTKNKNSGSGSGKKSGGGGSGNSYTKADADQDKKEILADIKKYEADIKADLYDQTEELIDHYNLESNKLDKIKKELDYYNDIYDSTEETTKWLETQNKLLDNQSKKVSALQKSNDKIEKQRQKIYKENSKYNVQGWFDSEGNETLAYGDLINSKQRQIEANEEAAAKKMREQYNKIKKSTNKKTIQNAKDKIKLIKEETETKNKALEEEIKKIEQIRDDVEKLNDAWEENQDAIREALAELKERVKEIRDELIDKLTAALERAVETQNEALENNSTRLENLITIQEEYNSLINDLADTQADLRSELESNLDAYEYLDEDLRQLMFNEDDYKSLNKVIQGISKDVTNIWADHYSQISNLTDDEMYKAEFITKETERQLNAKKKEYELAKAELDVAKAQANLQNVQNERNTRMFINGQWQWVANPDAVKEAKKGLSDAKAEQDKIKREQSQQEKIDSMNRLVDSNNEQIEKNNTWLEKVEKAIEDATIEVKNVQTALENMKKENLPLLVTLLKDAFGDGGSLKKLLDSLNEADDTYLDTLKQRTVDEGIAALKSGKLTKSDFEALINSLGYSFNETTGKVTTPDGEFDASYQGFVKKSNADTQTHTDSETGDQITDNGNKSSSGSGSGGSNTKKSSSKFPKTGKVTTKSSNLNLRAKPNTSSKIIKKMPPKAKVEILGEENKNWAKVKYGGKTGYASRKYLSYDQGGLANGMGVFLKDVNVPERVLSPKQTKAFEKLVDNLTTSPVLQALTRNIKGSSNFNNTTTENAVGKNYYFSNFTVQADNISEFINSLEGMIPISKR